ncbi:hypothetical protein FJZ19_04750 [Candidatus Pacearchaeota archaeon]|nr:hypothetical protein [Candidatus Pacearchaeota archaeon]
MTNRKIRLFEICYTSEWALAKFFQALFKHGLDEYFNLVGISGRESFSNVPARIFDEIIKRASSLKAGKNWREENTKTEIRSLLDILGILAEESYYQSGEGNIEKFNGDYEAAAIFSRNTTHIRYVAELAKRRKHVLCEKPLVILTNDKHLADRKQLNELEKIVKQKPDLILMDSEHYSAKRASIAFFERVGDMISEYGRIARIKGTTREKDDPEKERTRKLLCRKNKTGLLLDMGVHLFGIITNINGEITNVADAEYDIYPGHQGCLPYDVETFSRVKLDIKGNLFHDKARAEFEFAKFIHRLKIPEEKDRKEVIVTFKDKSSLEREVKIDFVTGKVTDTNGREWHSYSNPSGNEYMNILKDFYNAIIRRQQPRTSFRNSIKNLDAIYRTYKKFPVAGNPIEVYQR